MEYKQDDSPSFGVIRKVLESTYAVGTGNVIIAIIARLYVIGSSG